MRTKIVLLFLLLPVVMHGNTIDSFFRNMPGRLLPGFTEQHRERLLATQDATITYVLGEIVKLQHTDTFLELKTSSVGTMQIKLLPISWGRVVICVVRTVCGSGCHSQIQFFDRNWRELDARRLMPEISPSIFIDPLQKEAGNDKYALSLSGISPISAQLNGHDNDIVLTFNYKSHLSDEMIMELSPFLRTDTVVLQWRNRRFQFLNI